MFPRKLRLLPSLLTVLLLLGLITMGAADLRALSGGSGLAQVVHTAGGLLGGGSAPMPPALANAWQAVPGHPGVEVGHSLHNDTSPPLRDLPPGPPATRAEHEPAPAAGRTGTNAPPARDPIVQNQQPNLNMPAPQQVIEGINFTHGCGDCTPPDPNGDVGFNQYVQAVNESFEVFGKDGSVLQAAEPISTIWQGFPGLCAITGQGDPIVLFDRAANNWVISQFAFFLDDNGNPSGEMDQCIAVSTSGDATGAYHRYDFFMNWDTLPDYPKMGVWRDGYYMSVIEFDPDNPDTPNPRPLVFQRSAMLNGQPASVIRMPRQNNASPLLPADQESVAQADPGEPNFYMSLCAFAPASCLNVFKFHVDWNTPGNSSFTVVTILVPALFSELCLNTRDCILQPNFQALDAISDRLMNRLSWRRANVNGSTHDVLVANHTVNAGGGQAGVRWYEILDPDSHPTIAQQGTFAPGIDNRWMGSIAMDKDGDIALGYSVSSVLTMPAIRYTGRLAGDPPNTLRAEGTIIDGGGMQSGSNRWGDYSSMNLDPSDGCTFWYTNEYIPAGANRNWHTKIGTFKFAGCGQ